MRKLVFFIMFFITSCSKFSNQEFSEMSEPSAEKIPHITTIHDQELIDDYHWLRDDNWPEVKDEKVLTYLKEENEYSQSYFNQFTKEKEKIFEELKGRIKLSDESAPIKRDDYFYYVRTEEKKDYPIHCRKHKSVNNKEEILLDQNTLAKGKKYFKMQAFAVSNNHNLIAYSSDDKGSERYNIKVYDINNKKYFDDNLVNTIGAIVWDRNDTGFFYTPVDENWRHRIVKYHKLGDDVANDKVIYEEEDQLFNTSIGLSNSREYLFINVSGHGSNEIHVLDLKKDDANLELVKAREDEKFYEIEHSGDHFYMLTNDIHENFRVLRIETDSLEFGDWREYIAADSNKHLQSIDVTTHYLILNYRHLGLPAIEVLNLNNKFAKNIKFDAPAFTANAYSANYHNDDIRVNYSALNQPNTTYVFNYVNEKKTILKIQEIPSGFNPEDYVVERIWAENNGVKVPVSLVYRKSMFKHDGSNPVYLYGYGSYGITVDPNFRSSIFSLVDRGFIYAIAHIRGGEDLGFNWHKQAKFLNKKVTFEDFIACAEKLVNDKYTSEGNIFAMGGSAGGMLMGAVANMRPELFKAIIAHVPFVDVLNTMLDETLPLTPGEFKEWGNPKELEYFEYIKSYSPYDNVTPQDYPNIFVTAGISDPRVTYWEPAKWVAKLREMKTDNNLLLLKTNMDAGHGGASGRFDALKEVAEEFVFIKSIYEKQN